MRVLLWFPQWVLLKRIWAHSIAMHSGPGFTTTTRAIYSSKRCVSLATIIFPWNGILLHLKGPLWINWDWLFVKALWTMRFLFSPRQDKARSVTAKVETPTKQANRAWQHHIENKQLSIWWYIIVMKGRHCSRLWPAGNRARQLHWRPRRPGHNLYQLGRC